MSQFYLGNVRGLQGPQGVQGPIGPQGPAGDTSAAEAFAQQAAESAAEAVATGGSVVKLDKQNGQGLQPISPVSIINDLNQTALGGVLDARPGKVLDEKKADRLELVFDRVIRTQTEFNTLVSSPDWLGAVSVAFIGQFVYGGGQNPYPWGIKIPQTVKHIQGYNSAKITITQFIYSSEFSLGALWYAVQPETSDYSIRDITVDCTGQGSGNPYSGATCFNNCVNLINCTAHAQNGSPTGYNSAIGFWNCISLINCVSIVTAANPGGYTYA